MIANVPFLELEYIIEDYVDPTAKHRFPPVYIYSNLFFKSFSIL